MNLFEIILRDPKPEPWAEGDNIPWNEPGFSERMLKEHLNQDHDLASRRMEKIRQHVDWLAQDVLEHTGLSGGTQARILDLGCGPGLYCQLLARLGHTCTGIDFSPASIEYALQQAAAEGLSIDYRLDDLRMADYGPDGTYDMVMLIYGELNVFKPADARKILLKAFAALKPGGRMVLEPSRLENVIAIGKEPSSWWSSTQGLFGDQPHVVLTESFWDKDTQTATKRFFRVDASTATMSRFASTQQAYTKAEYASLLAACGFSDMVFTPGLGIPASADDTGGQFWGIIAHKRLDQPD
jgi:2-polyprenyl-3-methyl-5-hydroxy-6-metoxy-1,4-benzoquinol methylase